MNKPDLNPLACNPTLVVNLVNLTTEQRTRIAPGICSSTHDQAIIDITAVHSGAHQQATLLKDFQDHINFPLSEAYILAAHIVSGPNIQMPYKVTIGEIRNALQLNEFDTLRYEKYISFNLSGSKAIPSGVLDHAVDQAIYSLPFLRAVVRKYGLNNDSVLHFGKNHGQHIFSYTDKDVNPPIVIIIFNMSNSPL